MAPRFTLFIKQNGTCPFSQRAFMFMCLRIPRDQFVTKEIDLQNKTEEFLKLNPEGKVPVLIDHDADNKVVSDSAVIVQYVDDVASKEDSCDLACGHQGECVSAGSGVFSAFAKFMKNKDPEQETQFRENSLSELKKLNDFLEKCGKRFLMKDQLTEPDCTILPRLNQIRAAGPSLKNFAIPADLRAIWSYLEAAKSQPVWTDTCPTDEHICQGWAVHM